MKDDPRARMLDLARKAGLSDKGGYVSEDKNTKDISDKLHPPHGARGDFVKLSITLPPELYQTALAESGRRKVARRKDRSLSDIIRDALADYLCRNQNLI